MESGSERIKYLVLNDGSGDRYYIVANIYDPKKTAGVSFILEKLAENEKTFFLFSPSFEWRGDKIFVSDFRFYPVFGDPYMFSFEGAVDSKGRFVRDTKKVVSVLSAMFSKVGKKGKKKGEPEMRFFVSEGILPSKVLFSGIEHADEETLETWKAWLRGAREILFRTVSGGTGFRGVHFLLRCKGKRCGIFRKRKDSGTSVPDVWIFLEKARAETEKGIERIEKEQSSRRKGER